MEILSFPGDIQERSCILREFRGWLTLKAKKLYQRPLKKEEKENKEHLIKRSFYAFKVTVPFRYKQLLLKSVLPEDEFDKCGIQLLTPVPTCSHTPEVDAGPVISIQMNSGDAPPASLRFHNLSAILWVNPQRVPASPARCLTPSDAHVINQVTRESATVSDTAGKKKV